MCGLPYEPRTLQMRLKRIKIFQVLHNLNDENNFIDLLGLERASDPDPLALKSSECTSTSSTSWQVCATCKQHALSISLILISQTLFKTFIQKL